MIRVLVIGGAGFVGPYLLNELKGRGMQCFATKLPGEAMNIENVTALDLDVLDRDAVECLFMEIRPDFVFHLAAQASVGLAWAKPELTIDVNIKGSLHVMEAVRELYYKPRVMMIGSGEEYGHIFPGETPVSEKNSLRPGNIYAATKACQNMMSEIYFRAYDLQTIMVRAFNHMGPGQTPAFVVSDFCRQVAEIEAGAREPVMRVGNLEAMRDFTDVRDVVRAYAMLMQKGTPGETYNVGSGKAVSIRSILDKIISMADTEISVETDPAKIRPVDIPIIEADISKLREATGWEPEIPIEQTLRDTLEYWRDITKKSISEEAMA